jgi:hypothetical protein
LGFVNWTSGFDWGTNIHRVSVSKYNGYGIVVGPDGVNYKISDSRIGTYTNVWASFEMIEPNASTDQQLKISAIAFDVQQPNAQFSKMATIIDSVYKTNYYDLYASGSLHSFGGSGIATWAGDSTYYGGGKQHASIIYGDQYGNGSSYSGGTTGQISYSFMGGKSGGYFRGGDGAALYGAGGAGVFALGGNAGNTGGSDAGGGSGIYAQGGLNGDSITRTFSGYFNGGNVAVMNGFLGIGTNAPDSLLHVAGAGHFNGTVTAAGYIVASGGNGITTNITLSGGVTLYITNDIIVNYH